ncbi:MAG: MarR family winged helix-turn-helix transcriptional regulator [Alphaproteobacteria bacterium]|jgi:DNA-binding MarR family transcriptional regulator|nr:hypothetical protein [Rhodospirillaceae bacterium]MDP6406252.1 MarR family winged helix-turn-helix transcriptional regulator [Alphaproteobacteria bacterium]MDP6623610.1 MarR family winged helix-turn-helix transcriptional regulator [Alphaproteobacteria bacterium]|tara:strand:+ start:533 stop:952 length:420 start_codon:yes stop_codon:yes gene_type:complete
MDQAITAVVTNLLRLGAYLAREGDRLLHEMKISQQEFVVLMAIKEEQPVSQTQMCAEFLFEKSNMSKIVRRLTDGGLIEVSYAPTDRRVRLLRVSTEGQRTVNRCMSVLDDWNRQWLATLSQAELEETSSNLKRLLSCC